MSVVPGTVVVVGGGVGSRAAEEFSSAAGARCG